MPRWRRSCCECRDRVRGGSNRGPADWCPLFPNPVVAESLLDRLINTSHQVFMNGPSYRPNKRPGRDIPTRKDDIR